MKAGIEGRDLSIARTDLAGCTRCFQICTVTYKMHLRVTTCIQCNRSPWASCPLKGISSLKLTFEKTTARANKKRTSRTKTKHTFCRIKHRETSLSLFALERWPTYLLRRDSQRE